MSTLSSKIRKNLKESQYADASDKKLPLTDPNHVRNAAARLNQVKDISPAHKKLAQAKIKAAEKRMGIK